MTERSDTPNWLPCIFCKGAGSLYVSDETKALAEKAVEAQHNDKRTPEERIRDGAKFILGPGGDEGTRFAESETGAREAALEEVRKLAKRLEDYFAEWAPRMRPQSEEAPHDWQWLAEHLRNIARAAAEPEMPDELKERKEAAIRALKAQPSPIELKTTTGVMQSVESYNETQDDLLRYRIRTIRAYQIISHISGMPEARDFDKLEALIDADEGHVIEAGIAVYLSESDKDVLVPLAHAAGLTLGAWMRRELLLKAQPSAVSALPWIPVSERLPVTTGFYLIWCENDHHQTPRLCIWQAHWDQLKRTWSDFGPESAYITHWIPMNAPTAELPNAAPQVPAQIAGGVAVSAPAVAAPSHEEEGEKE
jgi:hypothetical protein